MSDIPAVTFTHVEQILLRRLRSRGGDVPISVLYSAAYGTPHRELPLKRTMQQWLGWRFAALNKKLEATTGERVVVSPRLKGYYRLEKRAAVPESAPAAG